jgi:hypothetical protein
MTRQTITRHQPIADGLRALPYQWGQVSDYPALYTALTVARNIRTGRYPAYPAGDFEAEIRTGDEGEPIVYARYIGAPALLPLNRGLVAARAAAENTTAKRGAA